jgi:hypothetical protein
MPRTFRRGDEYIYRHIAGEHLLVALRRREAAPLYALTPTSAFLWELLGAWVTPEALAQALTERFDVSAEGARADVEAFLEQLLSIKAVDVQDEA